MYHKGSADNVSNIGHLVDGCLNQQLVGCLGANHVNISALAYLSINKKSADYQNVFC